MYVCIHTQRETGAQSKDKRIIYGMNPQTHQGKTGTRSNELLIKKKVLPSLSTAKWSLLQLSDLRSPVSCLPKDHTLRGLQPAQGLRQLSEASNWLRDAVPTTENTELKMTKGREKELTENFPTSQWTH